LESFKVGIVGCGTVGGGVVKLLLENGSVIERRIGKKLEIAFVADKEVEKVKRLGIPEEKIFDDGFKALSKPCDVVVELIGGTTVAKEIILKAIERGRHVVTANKALLAESGEELFKKARERGVSLKFEASVGGGIPVIKALREGLSGNRIKRIYGIINGTANYILTEMTEKGINFETALKKAQRLGYAEADPTFDVEGIDTAHKLAILAAMAFGTPINFDSVHVEGIANIQPVDIEFAREFGYKIKLLAIAKQEDGGIEARVHPTMIPEHHMLAKIDGVFNAVYINADMLGPSLYYGQGAGMLPTASAVVADLVDIARNMLGDSHHRLPFLAYQEPDSRKISYQPIDAISCNYYLRFTARDQPGVLSKISGVLGSANISIASVIQKGRNDEGGTVAVVMQTHRACERDLKYALEKIDAMEIIDDRTVVIRMETDL